MHASPPPPQQMFQLITGYWASQIVGALARLGVPDALSAGPAATAELAGRVGAHPGALGRVLRAAALLGVVIEEAGTYRLTPVGETLRANVPGSMRDFAIAETGPGHWLPWGHLEDAVRTGNRTSRDVLGMEIWDWYGRHPAEGAAFSGAMANLAALVAGDLASGFDLGGKRIVDVGGAHGTLLSAILKRVPDARGVLLDLPHVVEGARTALSAQGLGGRVECVAGDFFASVPAGDVILLKQILHDWDDEQCRAILSRCAASARPGARALVVEMVIPDDGSPGPAQMMDINMLVMLTGRERTRAEYAALLGTAGFVLERELHAGGGFTILDCVRI